MSTSEQGQMTAAEQAIGGVSLEVEPGQTAAELVDATTGVEHLGEPMEAARSGAFGNTVFAGSPEADVLLAPKRVMVRHGETLGDAAERAGDGGEVYIRSVPSMPTQERITRAYAAIDHETCEERACVDRPLDVLSAALVFRDVYEARNHELTTVAEGVNGAFDPHRPQTGPMVFGGDNFNAGLFVREEEMSAYGLAKDLFTEHPVQTMRDFLDCYSVEDPSKMLTVAEVEVRHILRVLTKVNGNKSKAARVLGLDRRTLYRKLEKILKAEKA